MKTQIFTFCCVLQLLHLTNISIAVPKSLTLHLLDRSSNRIVGGRPAPDRHAKFQCSLQENLRHSCGCSILSDKWVVTAAHCVNPYPAEQLSILVGTNNLKNGGTRYQVDKQIMHENYGTWGEGNDIALVRVTGIIEFNGKVQPIGYSQEEVPDDTKLELTGWGKTYFPDGSSEDLQLIELNALSLERCKVLFPVPTSIAGIICTFTRYGEGACGGDSGSPLVWRRDSKVQLIGIVSYGVYCAKGYPDVYTKVSHYYDWINKHIT